jgi:hypothetical protein
MLLSWVPTSAKRVSPKTVVPVVYQGVEYSAVGDGRVQYVLATEVATGMSLWKVKVFHTFVKPWIEEDVQWVFITDLKLAGQTLLIRDEKSRCYSLDLKTRRVQKERCNR